MLDSAALRARLADVRDRIARAASRAGRDPAAIRLIAVSKTFSPDHIRAAADTGQVDFGENKIQEALAKMDALADLPLRWHMIGHLQSNKARRAAGFYAIHGVDGMDVLDRVDQAAVAAGRHPRILIQVDLAQEATKFGAPPETAAAIVRAAAGRSGAVLAGLMTLPPEVDDPGAARPYFIRLRALRDDLVRQGLPAAQVAELSMGMSHDFEVAVEEGATLVRVGSAIFGERTYGV